jgi:hypothetical protein
MQRCPRSSSLHVLLLMGRIEGEIEVGIRRFFLSQVTKHRHPASVGVRRRPHHDGCTDGDFSYKLRQASSPSQGTQGWDRCVQKLVGARIGPDGAMADVACGFHNVLAYAERRFFYRYLFPFGARDLGELLQIGNEGPNLNFAQVMKWGHVLPSIVESLQQGGMGLLHEFRGLGRSHIHTDLLHSLYGGCVGRGPDGIEYRVNFRRSAEARGAMASLTIQAIEI